MCFRFSIIAFVCVCVYIHISFYNGSVPTTLTYINILDTKRHESKQQNLTTQVCPKNAAQLIMVTFTYEYTNII